MNSTKSQWARTILALVAVISGVIAIFLVTGCSASGSPSPDRPVTVQQLPTARSIATELGGTNFKPMDPKPLFGMTSAGTFFIGDQKYAVNVFTTPRAMDTWLQTVTQFGVNPRWKTSTAVVYPSVLAQLEGTAS
jgi:hypothetical protein